MMLSAVIQTSRSTSQESSLLLLLASSLLAMKLPLVALLSGAAAAAWSAHGVAAASASGDHLAAAASSDGGLPRICYLIYVHNDFTLWGASELLERAYDPANTHYIHVDAKFARAEWAEPLADLKARLEARRPAAAVRGETSDPGQVRRPLAQLFFERVRAFGLRLRIAPSPCLVARRADRRSPSGTWGFDPRRGRVARRARASSRPARGVKLPSLLLLISVRRGPLRARRVRSRRCCTTRRSTSSGRAGR